VNASPHSQAHLQFAQANAKAKNCKRACLSANAFLPTRKNKIMILINGKIMTEMKKAQQVTMYKRNAGLSA